MGSVWWILFAVCFFEPYPECFWLSLFDEWIWVSIQCKGELQAQGWGKSEIRQFCRALKVGAECVAGSAERELWPSARPHS